MRLAIFGAGGHGGVIADSAESLGWNVSFFSDGHSGRVGEWEILGSGALLLERAREFEGVIVAIGANAARLDWLNRMQTAGARIATIIDRTAIVSSRASIGEGCFLAPGSIVNRAAVIERGCIINTGATVDHDCHVGEACHLSPGVHLSGTVCIGRTSWLGTGTSVRNNIVIGDAVVAGVGSVIVNDIASGLTVVGVPARPLERS
jgi:sugar O-acyltransferase (sialic acid O-acetyltransferase NeuD family)